MALRELRNDVIKVMEPPAEAATAAQAQVPTFTLPSLMSGQCGAPVAAPGCQDVTCHQDAGASGSAEPIMCEGAAGGAAQDEGAWDDDELIAMQNDSWARFVPHLQQHKNPHPCILRFTRQWVMPSQPGRLVPNRLVTMQNMHW